MLDPYEGINGTEVKFSTRLEGAWKLVRFLSVVYWQRFIFYLRLGSINTSEDIVLEKNFLPPKRDQLWIISAVESALDTSGSSKRFPAPRDLRFKEGMSGQRFRSFLFHLSKNLGTFCYLEIGVWKGSTASCILKGGNARAILVDNWSQFGAPRKVANKKLRKYIKSLKATLIDSSLECLRAEYNFESPLVYFYDGSHDYHSHLEATLLINQFKCRQLIYIVDDWNWENVRNGTFDGLKNLDFKLLKQWEIFSDVNDRGGAYGSWHNGVFISFLSR